ncbi:MAG TPA: hypothetical protein PLB00_07435 [Pseudomonadota bacterium]|jgi:hypothetical protein|nr:hypothetical protein [Pseudomonadota bacterium]
MSAHPRLEASTQARLLDLIGIARYVRRGAAPVAAPEDIAPATTRRPTSSSPSETIPTRPTRAAPAQAAPQPTNERTAAARPSLLAELGREAQAPQLLLFVESPRAPDPRGQLLLAAIRRMLPPHQMLDAGDVPTQWLPQAIALGGHVTAPADTSMHVAPPLSSLRQNVAAKRALWRAIRRLRRDPPAR